MMFRSLIAAVLVSLYPFTITKVVDGDTVHGIVDVTPQIMLNTKVRFTCSAPELSQDGGVEAKRNVENFVDGGNVYLDTSWRLDKYGRTLGNLVKNDAGYCP